MGEHDERPVQMDHARDVIAFGLVEQMHIAFRGPFRKVDEIERAFGMELGEHCGDFRAVGQPARGLSPDRHAWIKARCANHVYTAIPRLLECGSSRLRDHMNLVPAGGQPMCFQIRLRPEPAFGGFGRIFLGNEGDSHGRDAPAARSSASRSVSGPMAIRGR